MASVLLPPQQPRGKDWLDIIQQGLGIAEKFYGIAAEGERLDAYKAEQKQKQAETEQKNYDTQRLAEGRLYPMEMAEFQKTHQTSPRMADEKGPAGAIPIYQSQKNAQGVETSYPLWAFVKKAEPKGQVQEYVNSKGERVKGVIDLNDTGKEFKSPGDKPKEQALQKIKRVNPKTGKLEETFVIPTKGMTWNPGDAPKGSGSDDPFKKLGTLDQQEALVLAKGAARKTDIANQMRAELKNYREFLDQNPPNEEQAVLAGEGMGKLLNSAVSADALSNEEAQRILGLLYNRAYPDLSRPGFRMRRDLEGFYTQAKAKADSIDAAASQNKQGLKDIFEKNGISYEPTTAKPKQDLATLKAALEARAALGDKAAIDALNKLNSKGAK